MKKPELQALLQDAMKSHRVGNIEQAKNLYKTFLLHEPDRPDVLYNLALAFISLNKVNAAISTLEKVLDRVPGHLDALNNLGALLLKNNQHEQALQCFSSVLSVNPEHLEARNNLAGTLLQLGRFAHASKHYLYLLEKTPDDIHAFYNYGICLLELGNFEEAITAFKKVLNQNPNHFDAMGNMSIAYLKLGNFEKARKLFKIVLDNKPNNPEIRYLYSAITHQDIPDKPPKEYIENLFDHYAVYYEQHMIDALHYHTPKLLYDLLEKNISTLSGDKWNILDLGCGTGLSGIPFYPLSHKLVGVDLSAKMLDLAKSKSIYDVLIQDDLIEVLKKTINIYDLLLSSDTFNYFGDLDSLFLLCFKALKDKGFLLFSLEESIENTDEWTLKPHGRYLHTKNYIEKMANRNNFKMISIENTALREQNHIPVKGLLCLFQK